MAKALLASFILFTLFTHFHSAMLPLESIIEANEILSESGYLAMSFSLQLVSQTSRSSHITVFAASDEVFKDAGKPSLHLLLYHFLPQKFTIENLRSLSYGTAIPTMLKNHKLIVTTASSSDLEVSLNNVTINGSAIFESENVVVYGINKFFDLNFKKSPISIPSVQYLGFVDTRYSEIANKLRDTKYSAIGDFLDLQLLGFRDENKLTIFAPDDDELQDQLSNFTESPPGLVFRRHVVPVLLTFKDMMNLSDGAEFPTFLKGFNLNFSKSGDVMMFNGVQVVTPEVYSDDFVVIHGIEKLLELNDQQGLEGDAFFGFLSNNTQGVLYCVKKIIIFVVCEVLLAAITVGLYFAHRCHPRVFLIGSYCHRVETFLHRRHSSVYLTCSLTCLEVGCYVCEFMATLDPINARSQLLTIPLTMVILYLSFTLYHYHPPECLVYRVLDLSFMVITVNWTLFLRVSELIGYPIPNLMKVTGPSVFLLSLVFHCMDATMQSIRHESIGICPSVCVLIPVFATFQMLPLAIVSTLQ